MEEEYLYLGLGQLEIDWSKGSFQKDHTILFKTGDRKDISYFYYNEDEPKKFSTKKAPGYGKKLIEVKDRLDLLGYSFKNLPKLLREQFEHLPYEIPEIRNLSVEKFISTLSTIEVSGIRFGEHEGDAGLGEFFQRRILSLPAFAPIGKLIQKIRSFDYYLFEQIDPYIILAALANNPKNQKIELCLRSDAAITPPTKQQRYLVVTEGKTDVAVIQKAMEILKPNIADLLSTWIWRKTIPLVVQETFAIFLRASPRSVPKEGSSSYSTMMPKVRRDSSPSARYPALVISFQSPIRVCRNFQSLTLLDPLARPIRILMEGQ
ncbi:HEPN/Toprim-associated domain-containing protein [Pedobacter suwonensis]|uniref:HEPN/Toprim-associated domain-containing protein n=1 Tax=Pedobacter suwonensis TaxID=332999 RepID=UPI0036C0E3A6